MEEIDLKKIWKTGEKSIAGLSQERISEIISQKPHNVIASFVRSLKIELWVNLVVLSGATLYLISISLYLMAVGTLVLDVLFFSYYKSLITRLGKEYVDQNVVEYLNDMHQKICQFIRHFKITLLIAGTLSFCTGILLGFSDQLASVAFFDQLPLWKWIVMLATVTISLGLVYLFFYHMYGKKAVKIKRMVESLKKEG